MTTDTLKLAQALRRAGHSAETAEGTAAAVAEFVDQGAAVLATKADLADVRGEMKDMELRLIKWIVGTVVGSVLASTIAILSMLARLLP
jgi:hypothetical protein